MIPLGPVVARSRVRASRADVWAALVEPGRRAAWWPELKLESQLGGRVAEQWSEGDGDDAVSRDATGEVDVWVDGHALGYRWREAGDERDTAVLITLRSQGLDTGITVTETGFDALASPAERAAASQDGWRVLLADLVDAVLAAPASSDPAAVEGADGADIEAAADAAGEGDVDLSAGDAEQPTAGDLEVVPLEIDGELLEDGAEDGVANEAAGTDVRPDADPADDADDAEIVELDAEPEVGDHPELNTGPVPTIRADADADADTDADTDADADVDSDSDVDEHHRSDVDSGAESAAANVTDRDPDEPDFDSLIRGS